MASRHNLKNVLGNWGAVPFTGLAKDTAVQIAYNEDWNSVQVGGDGKANTRSEKNDRSARITLTVQQNSITNALLSAQLVAQEEGGVSPGLTITSLDTGETFIAQAAWIAKPPDAEQGEEAGTRQWVFETDRLIPTYGDATIIENNTP